MAHQNPAVKDEVARFMRGLIRRNEGETQFHQAVREVVESLMPFVLEHRPYRGGPDPGASDGAGPRVDFPGLLGG